LPVALAVASGLLYCAAMPPAQAWPLAFYSWAPLVVALRRTTPWRAMGLGALQAFFGNAVVCASTAPHLGAVPLAEHVVRGALLAWLATRASKRGWPLGLTFVMALAATEGLFPLSYSATEVEALPILTKLAELGGPVVVGAMLATANVGMAEVGAAWLERRTGSVRVAVLTIAAPNVMLAYGACRLHADATKTNAGVLPWAIVGVVLVAMGLFTRRPKATKAPEVAPPPAPSTVPFPFGAPRAPFDIERFVDRARRALPEGAPVRLGRDPSRFLPHGARESSHRIRDRGHS